MPVVASTLRRANGCKVGVVRLSQFSSGAHGEVYAALKRSCRSAGRRRSCSTCAPTAAASSPRLSSSPAAFLTDGPIVTTRGRSVKEQTLRATGDPIVPKAPLDVLVDHDTASASEIVTGALQDRGRAKVVGQRTFGKGVFQEVLELSNGGALDITAGQYFTPKGRNLGGKGVKTGKGIAPDIPAKDDPRTTPATRRSTARWPSPAARARADRRPTAGRPPRPARALPCRRAVLRRGRRVTVERSRDARPGRLALLRAQRRRAGAPRSPASSGARTWPATSSRR